MKIIGGLIAYEDGIKTVPGDQFSPTRKVRVELNFSLDEGDDSDACVGAVLDKAQAFANSKLGLTAPTAAATTTVKTVEGEKPAAGGRRRGPGAKAKDGDGKTKDDLAEAAGVPASANQEVSKAADPDELDGGASEPANDELSDPLAELEQEEVAEISDAELNSQVTKHLEKIGAKPGDPRYATVRKVMAEHIEGEGPKVLRAIPQAKRVAFLAALAKIA